MLDWFWLWPGYLQYWLCIYQIDTKSCSIAVLVEGTGEVDRVNKNTTGEESTAATIISFRTNTCAPWVFTFVCLCIRVIYVCYNWIDVCVCMCVCVRERDSERERKREIQRNEKLIFIIGPLHLENQWKHWIIFSIKRSRTIRETNWSPYSMLCCSGVCICVYGESEIL